MKLRRYRLLALMTLVLLATVVTLWARDVVAQGSFQRSLKVSGPVDLDVTTGAVRPNELRGKVRGGGARIDLHTGAGNIHIQ